METECVIYSLGPLADGSDDSEFPSIWSPTLIDSTHRQLTMHQSLCLYGSLISMVGHSFEGTPMLSRPCTVYLSLAESPRAAKLCSAPLSATRWQTPHELELCHGFLYIHSYALYGAWNKISTIGL